MYLVRSENPPLELYTIVKTVFKTHEYRKLYYLNKITRTVGKKESICWSHYYRTDEKIQTNSRRKNDMYYLYC